MKIDIVPLVILIFCLGVFASALFASDLFSDTEVTQEVIAQNQELDD